MMRKFTQLSAIAAAIPEVNIDTDQILAARFLKTVSREGLGCSLFHSMRFDDSGNERADFVLNRSPWQSAEILIALDNFGCGSSREHAPWALADFGIRAIVAPSFAEIFRNNCYKNGILPVEIQRGQVLHLIKEVSHPATARIVIDLPAQTIETARHVIYNFEIVPERKEQLLFGQDEISQSEKFLNEVEAFENTITYLCPPIPLDLSFADQLAGMLDGGRQ